MVTLSAEDAPSSPAECSDTQMRLIAYSAIHDGIYGEYQGTRRARVPLPACTVMSVRKKWPEGIDEADAVAAGFASQEEGPVECEE